MPTRELARPGNDCRRNLALFVNYLENQILAGAIGFLAGDVNGFLA
jgi:hypothetical protein